MNTELYFLRVLPGVYQVGKESSVTIESLDAPARLSLMDDTDYRIEVLPMSRNARDFDKEKAVFVCRPENGRITFSCAFPEEDEYLLRIFRHEANERVTQLSVYAVKEDLYALRPLKGDLHVHSCGSDGRESPKTVAANYRAAGYDFMALTDHHNYVPSVQMRQAYRDIPLGIALINGEEVHSPDNFVHYVNFGAYGSVNAVFHQDKDRYYREVAAIQEKTTGKYPRDEFLYAAGVWVSQKIREYGGLSIFAHPHWISNVFNVPNDLTIALLTNQVFDAFELIGGQTVRENNYQTALWQELRAEGYKIPVVGSSDSHGTINARLFQEKYTLVFAENNTRDAIIDAVRKGNSAAVEVKDGFEVYGSYRHVAYGRFLVENYFAQTAQFCRTEGELMLAYSRGDAGAGAYLKTLATQSDRFYKKFFGKE